MRLRACVYWRVRILPLLENLNSESYPLLLLWVAVVNEEERSTSTKQAYFIHMLDEWFLLCVQGGRSSSFTYKFIECTAYARQCQCQCSSLVHCCSIVSSHNLNFCYLRSIRMKMRIFFGSHCTKESDFAVQKKGSARCHFRIMLFDMRIKVKIK